MKIAYLISAYSDPVHLNRLIGALYNEMSFFYIHVDKKSDINRFEKIISEEYENVEFIKNRIFTQWGGWSQVRYQQELLKAATQSNNRYDRYFIISGMDYPVISNAAIQSELAANPDKEYIIGLNITPIKTPKIRNKLVLYHFFRDLRTKNRTILRIFRGGSRLVMTVLPIRKKPYIEIDGKKLDVFMSSSYMCITDNLAKYIVDQMEKNISIMHYFRYSFVPEELVIPTIVFNSAYACNAMLYSSNRYDGLITLAAIHQFEYRDSIKIYNESDFDFLMEMKINNKKFFMRKAITGVSDKLLEMIDESRIA
ncbi:beta-1,6-N-acetylglucosaminyltransferase [Thiobaca trueperi]|uniref:Peptide O-xylosyltransferase n=1 Tax=Thiobaca trueperi TaxID=127458 RepID=A0A4R3MSL3_9GAMM|nr:beta-1,6-N-acetylglucosaminyltransferase [Thiobaca trueperi]TCT18707.1 core-2/I-Branching enzyme [Thiobaca trueperi]